MAMASTRHEQSGRGWRGAQANATSSNAGVGGGLAATGRRLDTASTRRRSVAKAALVAALAALIAIGVVPVGGGLAGIGVARADEGRVHSHALGFGYHTIILHTERADNYAIHGPSFVYDYFIGRRWGFAVRLAVFFPVLGSMSGPSGDFSGSLLDAYDQRHIGYDALTMVARRWALKPDLALVAGAGLHLEGFALNGAAYSPVEDDSLGIGGLGKLDYSINGWASFGFQLALGLDFIDLVNHANPSKVVFPISTSLSFAARY